MCVYFNPVPGGSEYEAWVKLVAKNDAKLNKEAEVQNKILMQCCGELCQSAGEIKDTRGGRPEGWFAVDVDGPGLAVKLSQVLCPGCFAALGIKLPTSEKPKGSAANAGQP